MFRRWTERAVTLCFFLTACLTLLLWSHLAFIRLVHISSESEDRRRQRERSSAAAGADGRGGRPEAEGGEERASFDLSKFERVVRLSTFWTVEETVFSGGGGGGAEKGRLIPKRVFVTGKTLPDPDQLNLAKMRKENPGWTFVLASDEDVTAFFEKNFSPSSEGGEMNFVLEAYRRIRLGVCKADLFRYAVMYLYGGVYVDLDAYLKPFDEWIREEDDVILAYEPNHLPDPSVADTKSGRAFKLMLSENMTSFLDKQLQHSELQHLQWVLVGRQGHPVFDLALRLSAEVLLKQSAALHEELVLQSVPPLASELRLLRSDHHKDNIGLLTGPALWTVASRLWLLQREREGTAERWVKGESGVKQMGIDFTGMAVFKSVDDKPGTHWLFKAKRIVVVALPFPPWLRGNRNLLLENESEETLGRTAGLTGFP
uniref:Alpha 1,4-glycosyltransferase domain-containing protein n=1 Tax=Chromera velia CCMP2878 TaxID=1169474 RepID=A0A0G4G7K5_9ALVE|eukprot:Cvel_20547.t1-p1 / transcript=Cvel_20547.t1 / gene=Cvel_20547 / organism=Chromera_velia_CCMP2878 / gene_product=Initiation-specific alpha-1,6-mannosyltransferase, putative / transcript_product=Initiation-specific alpha-1,6-mannosyltransferase, putative / location=Cvel_scaffold1854:23751-25034(+) / protein_length=428 / sequence_SO=supercontig / SO=protein_coding / is_pseudo=false